jgi:hypothetical protein
VFKVNNLLIPKLETPGSHAPDPGVWTLFALFVCPCLWHAQTLEGIQVVRHTLVSKLYTRCTRCIIWEHAIHPQTIHDVECVNALYILSRSLHETQPRLQSCVRHQKVEVHTRWNEQGLGSLGIVLWGGLNSVSPSSLQPCLNDLLHIRVLAPPIINIIINSFIIRHCPW